MAEWTLQYPTEIQNGVAYKVKAQHLTANFDALKSDIDDRLSAATPTPQTVVSQVTFSGGVKSNTIDEATAGTGVTADGVLLKDAGIVFSDAGELTVASGAITATGTFHTVDTESDAASDDLDTINGGAAGKVLVLQSEADARDVVVKHNTGNIFLAGLADYTLATKEESLTLIYSAALSKWCEISRAPGMGVSPYPGYKTGRYYLPFGLAPAGVGTAGQGIGSGTTVTIAVPILISHTTIFDRIGVNCLTAVGGSTVRLGIYNNGTDGRPGTRLLDASTVSTATTGIKEITISQQLTPGWYWLALSASNAGIGIDRGTPSSNQYSLAGYATIGTTVQFQGFESASVFPSTFGTATINETATQIPVIYLRAA